MEQLLSNIWIQGGSVGLLAASGWILWWLENKERKAVQEKKDELTMTLITFMQEQKQVIQEIADNLAFQKILEEEIKKISRKE